MYCDTTSVMIVAIMSPSSIVRPRVRSSPVDTRKSQKIAMKKTIIVFVLPKLVYAGKGNMMMKNERPKAGGARRRRETRPRPTRPLMLRLSGRTICMPRR